MAAVNTQRRPNGLGAAAAVSFSRLYEEYFDFTFRSLRYLGVPGFALEDAVQDVWLAVHRGLPEFEGRSSHRTWLFAIALNTARNLWRSERRAPGRASMPEHQPSPDPGPERIRAGREALELVERFLNTLSSERRVLFVSHLIENLSASECAELLGVEVAAIYPRVRDLRRGFKRWLDQWQEPE
jgi:RNA polymerase sigma-70 factor (ECF subfamily)